MTGSARERRSTLIAAMETMSAQGVDCARCVGTCCTFVANSMQISALEARDIVAFLKAAGRWTEETKARLQASVAQQSLDRPTAGNGARDLVRRRYTCPFYAGGSRGCEIDRDHKPYGCLAFNPKVAGLTQGGACGSDSSLLDEVGVGEGDLLRQMQKSPIPVAVLAVWEV